MKYPLHLEIGQFVRKLELPADCRLLLTTKCGGTSSIPLFYSLQKQDEKPHCFAEILIVKNGKIRVIIAIEKSKPNLTKIYGRFFTLALSTNFIHDVLNDTPTFMDKDVTLIQILEAGITSIIDSKDSYKVIEELLQNIIPLRGSSVTSYQLYCFQRFGGLGDNSTEKLRLKEQILIACSEESEIEVSTPSSPVNPAMEFDALFAKLKAQRLGVRSKYPKESATKPIPVKPATFIDHAKENSSIKPQLGFSALANQLKGQELGIGKPMKNAPEPAPASPISESPPHLEPSIESFADEILRALGVKFPDPLEIGSHDMDEPCPVKCPNCNSSLVSWGEYINEYKCVHCERRIIRKCFFHDSSPWQENVIREQEDKQ